MAKKVKEEVDIFKLLEENISIKVVKRYNRHDLCNGEDIIVKYMDVEVARKSLNEPIYE